MAILYNSLYDEFGWPDSSEIFAPTGIGAKVFVELARQKIGRSIERLTGSQINIGVLSSNPEQTESPLAVICEFSQAISQDVLLETQRLAWNFSHSLLLITIEPHIIRKWSCWEEPSEVSRSEAQATLDVVEGDFRDSPEISPRIDRDPVTGQCLQASAANALSWISLISGNFFREHSSKFRHESRADRMLLSNLKAVRAILQKQGLQENYCHDLLARIIFIQFLFDRKDSSGFAALSEVKLRELYDRGLLSRVYRTFAEILESYQDSYALFEWLDNHFNGDLFPQPKIGEDGKRSAWETERRHVNEVHLQTLASFVQGDIVLDFGAKRIRKP